MKIGKSLRDAIWRAMTPIVLSSLLVVGQPRAVSTMRSNMAKAIITTAHFVCRLSLTFFRRCSMHRKLQFNQTAVNEESTSKYQHVLLITIIERRLPMWHKNRLLPPIVLFNPFAEVPHFAPGYCASPLTRPVTTGGALIAIL